MLVTELPRVTARLRGAVENFGFPPYVLDLEGCLVQQLQIYHPDTRRNEIRSHVRKPGSFFIVMDRERMYQHGECCTPAVFRIAPYRAVLMADKLLFQCTGILPPKAEGEGAHAVTFSEFNEHLCVTVAGTKGIGQEFTIVSLDGSVEDTFLSLWLIVPCA